MVSHWCPDRTFQVLVLTVGKPNYSPQTPIDPRVEMFQKGQPTDAFFNMKALAPRPVSDATEMFDTEFEDSDVEESNSPRLSVNSVSRFYRS